jgi:predicted RNA-binding protein with TRAM domain
MVGASRRGHLALARRPWRRWPVADAGVAPELLRELAATTGLEVYTVEISDKLLCLFSAEVTREDDHYVVEVPRREVETGSVDPGDVYRVALLAAESADAGQESESSSPPTDHPQPPVEEGEVRYVEIEDLGKQGDGIARVERGYVIIVPDSEVGEKVKIEVTEVKSNFAVGEILEETFE